MINDILWLIKTTFIGAIISTVIVVSFFGILWASVNAPLLLAIPLFLAASFMMGMAVDVWGGKDELPTYSENDND
jgi:hypothetical protein